MDKNELMKTVREMMAAPSCCAELKEAARNWLDSIGTEKERAAGALLLQEIREDVCTIEHTMEFFDSPLATQIFGAAKAAAMSAHAHEIASKGAKWCDCPACAAGLKVLENASLLS